MSRTKLIQTRPELPSLEEIMKDLQSAPTDDVAFTFLRTECANGTVMSEGRPEEASVSSREMTDTSKSFESAAKRPRHDPSKVAESNKRSQQMDKHRKENDDIEECYSKVLRFLEMNSYLRDSQDALTQQCSDLQDLGQTVKDQIESLRTQLQS